MILQKGPFLYFTLLSFNFFSNFERMCEEKKKWKRGQNKHYFCLQFILLNFWKSIYKLPADHWNCADVLNFEACRDAKQVPKARPKMFNSADKAI